MDQEKPGETAGGGALTETVTDIPDQEITPEGQAAIQSLVEEIDRLKREITATHERIKYLEGVAEEDPPVPVVNRRAFVQELERANALARRYGTTSSVLYFDINGMKEINDSFGHSTGDKVLIAAADTLTTNVRASDTVGQLGGNEFDVILSHTDGPAADQKGNTLAGAIAELIVKSGSEPISVTAAYGVFTFTGDTDVEVALDASDKAMYTRKQDRAPQVLP